MAEVQRKKQGKKTELNINVVIGGFLVLGGALAAAAAVIAVFKNRSKRKPNNRSKKDPPANPLEEVNCTKNKEDIQGLRSLLQIPSLSDEKDQRKKEALRICSTQVGSRGPVTIENLILEKEFGLKSNGEEQTPTFEDHGPVLDNLKKSPPEADDYDSNKNGIPIDVEGVNLGVLENGSMKIVDSKEDPIYLPLVETEVVIEESVEIPEETRIVHVEERVVKEDVSVQEEEDDDDDEEDDDDDEDEEDDDEDEEDEDDEEDEEDLVEEKEGEGSDGTGDSSMDSNAEAIWPAESLEIREMKTTHVEISGKKGEKEAQKAKMGEVVKGTNQEHEENGKFENARETKQIMGKEKGMGTPIMEMEMSAPSSLISRLLLLSMIMGLAVLFLSHILSCNLYDFSNTLPKFF